MELHNNGKAKASIIATNNQLKHLQRFADLSKPETVKIFIANKTTSNSYKLKLCQAYNFYCKHYKIEWTMPKYKAQAKMPKLPTEQQLLKLIYASGKTLSLKLWLSKETGLRPTELQDLKVKDIDTEHNAVNPSTVKNGCARILTIPPNLTKALQQHATKYNLQQTDKLFRGDARKFGNYYRQMRNRVAKQTNDPTLKTVRLYDFRHWFATMRYWKYRDVPLTALDMGHKNWGTTQKYVHLLKILEMIKEDGYISKTATNIKEDQELIDMGFEYVTERDGIKLYRKRK